MNKMGNNIEFPDINFNNETEVSKLFNTAFSIVELAYEAELTARDCNNIGSSRTPGRITLLS